MEQSQNTISKEWTQDHIHRRKMSTILLWMHLCIHSTVAILLQFFTSNVHFVRKGCDWYLKITILPQFLTSKVHFVRKSCDWHLKIAILLQFLTFNAISRDRVATDTSKSQFYFNFWRSMPFRARRLRRTPQNRTFTSVFDVQRAFRARRLRRIPEKWQVYFIFWRSTSISCERVAADTSKSQFNASFWRSTSISCERVAADPSISRFYLCWTSDVHEMLRLSRFVALRRHRPRLKREIERRARERKERERRSAAVKVWRCRSADVKVWRYRSADVKEWRCRSADVKVWRCRSADVKVWRHRSADVLQRVLFYEEPFAGTLGNKAELRWNMLILWKFQCLQQHYSKDPIWKLCSVASNHAFPSERTSGKHFSKGKGILCPHIQASNLFVEYLWRSWSKAKTCIFCST